MVEAGGEGAGAEGGLGGGNATAQHLAAGGITHHHVGRQGILGQQQGDVAVGGIGREGEG